MRTPKFDNDFQELIWSRTRIAELEAENARLTQACSGVIDAVVHLRRRLAAVIALCDSYASGEGYSYKIPEELVRAAATGGRHGE